MIMFKNFSLISTTLLSIIIFNFSTFANSDENNLELKEINEIFYKDIMDMQDYYIAAIRVDEMCMTIFQKEKEFSEVVGGWNYEEYLQFVKRKHFNSLLLANWYVKQKYSEEIYEAFYLTNEYRIEDLMIETISFYFNKHNEFIEEEKALGKDEIQSYLGACNSFKPNFLILWHLTSNNEKKFTDLFNDMGKKINIPDEFAKDYLLKHIQLYNDLWRQN